MRSTHTALLKTTSLLPIWETVVSTTIVGYYSPDVATYCGSAQNSL